MAKEFGKRPSELLEVYDEWAAFQLDAAVLYLGRWVENKVSELDDKGKPKHKLSDVLADQPKEGDIRDLFGAMRQIKGAARVRKVVRNSAEG